MEACEVEHEVSPLGRRTLLLDAREVFSASKKLILLAIEDVTDPWGTPMARKKYSLIRNL
jgi:hypothetical protein